MRAPARVDGVRMQRIRISRVVFPIYYFLPSPKSRCDFGLGVRGWGAPPHSDALHPPPSAHSLPCRAISFHRGYPHLPIAPRLHNGEHLHTSNMLTIFADMSKTKIYIHVVFSTKNREKSITAEHATSLYQNIWEFLTGRDCKLFRIGGMPDHVHILFGLHPTIALSTLMQELKSSTSGWLKRNGKFPLFEGWSGGYYAGSVSPDVKDRVIEYIKNQSAHHQNETFNDEIIKLAKTYDLIYDPRDLI